MKAAVTIVVSAIMLAACASGYRPAYKIGEIRVVNNTQQLLREVSVRSGDRVFACGNIPALRLCSNKFPRRYYEYAPIEIEWALGQNAPRTESLLVDVPLTFSTGLPVRGVVEVNPDGSVQAHFEQDAPLR